MNEFESIFQSLIYKDATASSKEYYKFIPSRKLIKFLELEEKENNYIHIDSENKILNYYGYYESRHNGDHYGCVFKEIQPLEIISLLDDDSKKQLLIFLDKN